MLPFCGRVCDFLQSMIIELLSKLDDVVFNFNLGNLQLSIVFRDSLDCHVVGLKVVPSAWIGVLRFLR